MTENSAEVECEFEEKGFNTALYINLTKYNPDCVTPKSDGLDNFDRLSIESSSLVTSPRAHEKRESKFKFILSKDFLRRLSEESPLRYRKDNEEEVAKNLFVLDDEDIESRSTKNENTSDCSFEPKVLFKRPVLNSFSTNVATSDSEVNSLGHKNDSFTENYESIRKSKSSSKSAEHKNSLKEEQIILSNFNDSDKNITDAAASSCKNNTTILTNSYTNFNKQNDDMCLGSKNNKFNNVTQNFMMSNGFYNNPYLLLCGNLNGNSSINGNYGMGNININGKNGWICFVCNNFNYESKIII
jgi:hypothetical protein